MKIKKMLCCIFPVLLLTMNSVGVYAASENLPDSFLITDDKGIHAGVSGEYGFYLDDLKTGDTVTRTFTIRNLENAKVSLSMRSEEIGTTGPLDFMNNLHMKITLDGKLLYSGKLKGDGAATKTRPGNGVDIVNDVLNLGDYKSGGYGALKVELFMDTAHINKLTMSKKSTADVKWIFIAVKDEVPPPPKTGEIIQWAMYLLAGSVALAAAVVLFLLKRRRKTERQG